MGFNSAFESAFVKGMTIGSTAVLQKMKEEKEEEKRAKEEKAKDEAQRIKTQQSIDKLDMEQASKLSSNVTNNVANINKRKFDVMKDKNLTPEQKKEEYNRLNQEAIGMINASKSHADNMSRFTKKNYAGTLAGYSGLDTDDLVDISLDNQSVTVKDSVATAISRNPNSYGLGKDKKIYTKDQNGNLTEQLVADTINLDSVIKDKENTPSEHEIMYDRWMSDKKIGKTELGFAEYKRSIKESLDDQYSDKKEDKDKFKEFTTAIDTPISLKKEDGKYYFNPDTTYSENNVPREIKSLVDAKSKDFGPDRWTGEKEKIYGMINVLTRSEKADGSNYSLNDIANVIGKVDNEGLFGLVEFLNDDKMFNGSLTIEADGMKRKMSLDQASALLANGEMRINPKTNKLQIKKSTGLKEDNGLLKYDITLGAKDEYDYDDILSSIPKRNHRLALERAIKAKKKKGVSDKEIFEYIKKQTKRYR
jgi:hypothetical protein